MSRGGKIYNYNTAEFAYPPLIYYRKISIIHEKFFTLEIK